MVRLSPAAPARPARGTFGAGALWTDAYKQWAPAPLPPTIDADHLLAPFLLTPEQVTGAARSAAQTARLAGGVLTPEHVRQGARAQNAAGLDRLARRIEPTVTWDDLVLPPDTHAQLGELTARARHRDRVLGEWGMRPGAAGAGAYRHCSRATRARERRCRRR